MKQWEMRSCKWRGTLLRLTADFSKNTEFGFAYLQFTSISGVRKEKKGVDNYLESNIYILPALSEIGRLQVNYQFLSSTVDQAFILNPCIFHFLYVFAYRQLLCFTDGEIFSFPIF